MPGGLLYFWGTLVHSLRLLIHVFFTRYAQGYPCDIAHLRA